MSVYKKLNDARREFHKTALKKTGRNEFSKYDYFTLGDIVQPALAAFQKAGLCAVVTFDKEIATMTIVDVDKAEDRIVITSPMGSASLKGCHEVQNIGAVETYQRRYLWLAALDAVEGDVIEETTDTTSDYELEHLPTLQQAAEKGAMALQEAFRGLPNDPEKAAFWAKHSAELKKKAGA